MSDKDALLPNYQASNQGYYNNSAPPPGYPAQPYYPTPQPYSQSVYQVTQPVYPVQATAAISPEPENAHGLRICSGILSLFSVAILISMIGIVIKISYDCNWCTGYNICSNKCYNLVVSFYVLMSAGVFISIIGCCLRRQASRQMVIYAAPPAVYTQPVVVVSN